MFELAGPDSINLGLGELDFEPAKAAIEALDAAVRGGHNGYGPTRGIPELREALAQRLTKYRPDVETENVLVTAGATQGLLVTAMTLFDHGDEVLTPDPGFVISARVAEYVRVVNVEDQARTIQQATNAVPGVARHDRVADHLPAKPAVVSRKSQRESTRAEVDLIVGNRVLPDRDVGKRGEAWPGPTASRCPRGPDRGGGGGRATGLGGEGAGRKRAGCRIQTGPSGDSRGRP